MPAVVDGMKICTGCRENLPVSNYTRQTGLRDDLAPKCRPCKKIAADAYYAANHEAEIERAGWARIKYKYGITREDFTALLLEQDGVCAICRKPQARRGAKNLCVDHDHDTGQVRGLLCNACNLAIGYFKDNPDLLLRAADYLKQAEEIQNGG